MNRETQIKFMTYLTLEMGDYTGLCDKDGKPIYTKDYVQFSSVMYRNWVGTLERTSGNSYHISFTGLPENSLHKISFESITDIQLMSQSEYDRRWMELMKVYTELI